MKIKGRSGGVCGEDAHQLADALGRLETGARQDNDRRFLWPDHALPKEAAEGCRGARGGRLDVKPGPREIVHRLHDLLLGHRDGRAAGAPDGGQDFARPHGLCDRGSFGDRRKGLHADVVVSAGGEARAQGSAVRRLDGEEPRKPLDLPASHKFAEADVASEDIAAGAGRYEDVVGRPEPKVFPKLVGQRLRPWRKRACQLWLA